MAKLQVGDKMPSFTFRTESEDGLTTESVLKGGRTVFWVLRYIGINSGICLPQSSGIEGMNYFSWA